jgi:hypothetical protein
VEFIEVIETFAVLFRDRPHQLKFSEPETLKFTDAELRLELFDGEITERIGASISVVLNE